MTDQYAKGRGGFSGNRWIFSFDLKEESEE